MYKIFEAIRHIECKNTCIYGETVLKTRVYEHALYKVSQ